MFFDWSLILDRFEEYVRALQILVNANVEWSMTLTDDMAKLWKLLKGVRSVYRSDHFVRILSLVREVQLALGLVES